MLNKLFPDLGKFNVSLMKVQSSKPSGITDQQVINMAVAVHLKKANGRDYSTKDFDATKWPNYAAWMVLKNTRKFATTTVLVPTAPPAETEALAIVTPGTETISTPGTETSFPTEEDGAIAIDEGIAIAPSATTPFVLIEEREDSVSLSASTSSCMVNVVYLHKIDSC